MRRFFLVAVMGMWGGCGGDDDPVGGGPVTINFLRHDSPPYAQADAVHFAEYEAAHANVKIMPETIRYPSLTSTLLAELKTNKVTADLIRVPPSWVCSFADNVADVPADVVSLSEAQNTFFAAPLEGSTCNGKLKGLPIEYNLEYGGVVVNMEKYQKKFPGKSPAWTSWAQFIDEASMLSEFDTAMKPTANGLDIAPDWPQPVKHIFFSQILQRGGEYWSADRQSFDLSSAAAREALTDMVGWVMTKKILSPSLIPPSNTFVTTRLATGATGYGWSDPLQPLSVMGYLGTWGVPAVMGEKPAASTARYEFHTVPPMVGADHKFVQNSGWAFVVPKTAKNPKIAWDIVKSLVLSPSAMRRWSATTGALPALRENGTAQAAQTDPLLAKVQPLLERGRWVGYIPAGAIETVEGAMLSNFFEAAKGTKTIDQALTDMQTAANASLAQHR